MSADLNPPWAAVRELFEHASALPEAERQALLADPLIDPAVAAEVRSLLAQDLGDTRSGFLGGAARDSSRIGERLGPWRITGRLGSGGMGEVWRADRDDGAWRGTAAVKLLRRGMDSAAVLARFAQEQQALARLAHPHIARLIDAGRTADGLPYFVMEEVTGRPIDQACEGRPLNERLALFLQLADAVAHAHRNLLVHRDLKPGNVLVTAEGQVKLLDFGIAKALEGDDADATVVGERPFTPHYASPEQVRGEPLSTATDVYSLGVLLYVLLTGRRPYGQELTSPTEASRCVLEASPARPSQFGGKALRGDLDNIVLKALEKTVERRYASVEALAADLRAHLGGYPVSARAPSAGYLLSRLVRRNRAATGAATIALLAMVGGAAAALWQAHVADAQRDLAQQRFKQVRQLANQLVFKYHDQIENLPGATRAREALLADAAGFLDSLDAAGGDDPQLWYEMAATYYRISRLQGVDKSVNTGRHDLAEVNLDKALALARRYAGRPGMSAESAAVAVNMQVSKAEQLQRRGEMAQAEATLREGVPMLDRAIAAHPKDTWTLTSAISLHGVLARIQGTSLANASLGQWRDACASAERAREAADATLAADPANNYGPDSLAFALGEQANCAVLALRLDEAEALLRRQIALRELMAVRYADDMDFRYQRAVSRGQLARVLALQGLHAEARALQDEALGMARQAQRDDTGNRAGHALLLAQETASLPLHVLAGEWADAQRVAETLLAAGPAAEPGFPWARQRAETLVWAARAWRTDDPARALALAREATTLMAPARDGDDNTTRRWLQALARGEEALALLQTGDAPAAAAAADAALVSWGRPPQPEPPPLLLRWIEPLKALAMR
jgi:hypothetical protein